VPSLVIVVVVRKASRARDVNGMGSEMGTRER
jgi:hypothetical protein